jgi:DNA-binding response OmpR family regulator
MWTGVGLELGADDYLPKPFAVRELARVRALRRSAEPTPSELVSRRRPLRLRAHCQFDGPLDLTTHDSGLQILAERRERLPRIETWRRFGLTRGHPAHRGQLT